MRWVAGQWTIGLGWMLMTTTVFVGCDRQAPEHSATSSIPPKTVSPVLAPAASAAAPWVIDPTKPGPNLPPTGRSLFDFLITKTVQGKKVYDIPFPFSALVDKIESQLHPKGTAPVLKRLLIPVNRSLQRRAGEGAYFTYPRAVLAVDTESDPALASPLGMHLKDRLYVGYHEKTGVLEVISYNEAAGRFEFQVVTNYGPDTSPTVRYANRALCMACHQNQSPLFARPMWDETNVNPKIAALLANQHRQYYGFPNQPGVGTLQAFDDATDRANELSLIQLLWRDGCEHPGHLKESITCRAELAEWALRYGLPKGGVPDWHTLGTGHKEPSFLAAWRTGWPNGLSVPNPDIPNRNPFRYVAVSEFPGLSEVEATGLEGRELQSAFRGPYEPTQPREPLEIWAVPETSEALERVLAGFAHFFTKADLDRLARVLDGRPEQLHTALRALAQETLMGRTDVLANRPFRRVSLLAALETQLGTIPIVRCCLDDHGMPPPIDEMVEVHHSPSAEHEQSAVLGINTFQKYCSTCHHGADGFPPNFLHGSPAEVERNVRQCADRIFVRLSMWKTTLQEQLEAPMPPAMHLQHQGITPNQWAMHEDFQTLREEAASAVQQKRGRAFDVDSLLRQEYDTLPACLAPPHVATEAMGEQHG